MGYTLKSHNTYTDTCSVLGRKKGTQKVNYTLFVPSDRFLQIEVDVPYLVSGVKGGWRR